MKLISWNIDMFTDNREEVVDLLIEEDADIVCLQEVTAGLDRKVYKQYRKKRYIDTELEVVYRFKFFGANFETYPYESFGQKHDFGGLVQEGNYILSKCRFLDTENIFYLKSYQQIRDWNKEKIFDKPRSVQVTKIEKDMKTFQVINIHAQYDNKRRGSEKTLNHVKQILEIVKRSEIPTIIVGGFNLLPESEPIKEIEKYYQNVHRDFNVQETLVGKKQICDYVFVSNDIKIDSLHILNTKVSDHYPLVIDFELD